jgi:hypothetical protein
MTKLRVLELSFPDFMDISIVLMLAFCMGERQRPYPSLA